MAQQPGTVGAGGPGRTGSISAARLLLLYHTEDRNLAERKKLYAREGAQYYTGNLYIPEDLESLEL